MDNTNGFWTGALIVLVYIIAAPFKFIRWLFVG